MPPNEPLSAHEVIPKARNVPISLTGVKSLDGISFDLRQGGRNALFGGNGYFAPTSRDNDET
jgi:ABC-type sugar transport system ATPase subunit